MLLHTRQYRVISVVSNTHWWTWARYTHSDIYCTHTNIFSLADKKVWKNFERNIESYHRISWSERNHKITLSPVWIQARDDLSSVMLHSLISCSFSQQSNKASKLHLKYQTSHLRSNITEALFAQDLFQCHVIQELPKVVFLCTAGYRHKGKFTVHLNQIIQAQMAVPVAPNLSSLILNVNLMI